MRGIDKYGNLWRMMNTARPAARKSAAFTRLPLLAIFRGRRVADTSRLYGGDVSEMDRNADATRPCRQQWRRRNAARWLLSHCRGDVLRAVHERLEIVAMNGLTGGGGLRLLCTRQAEVAGKQSESERESYKRFVQVLEGQLSCD